MSDHVDDAMEVINTTSNFQFTAVNLDDVEDLASKYTLVTVCVDQSSSVTSFKSELEKMLKVAIESCQKSPNVENLMIRVVTFNHDMVEVHGFKLMNTIDVADYAGVVSPGGTTALNDTTYTAVEATSEFASRLFGQQILTNAVIYLITDGMDVGSTREASSVKKIISAIHKDESLESVQIILIGINTDPEVRRCLQAFQKEAGITQFIDAGQATPSNCAKVANFISRSVSSSSQALGTGQASQLLTLT